LSFDSDGDEMYVYILTKDQYINYLEKKNNGGSISNINSVASLKNVDSGEISKVISYFINPLYIIADPIGREVELNISYRYTILERSWFTPGLLLFFILLIISLGTYVIYRKNNPWRYFHSMLYEASYKRFKDGNYDDSILAAYKIIDKRFKKITERKKKGLMKKKFLKIYLVVNI